MIPEAVRHRGVASPPLDLCHALYGETEPMGEGRSDMAAVVRAIEARTGRIPADG